MKDTGIYPAEILLPRNTDMQKWASVACDQFTSEKEYWDKLFEFVGDDIGIEFRKFEICFYEHLRYRLTILYYCVVAAGTTENDDVEHIFHFFFEFAVYHGLIANGEVAKVYAYRGVFVA